MAWTRVHLVVPADGLAQLEALLWELGAISVAYADGGSTPWYEPGPEEASPWDRVRLQALFAPDIAPDSLRAAVQGVSGADAALEFDTLPDRDWARAWMQDWKPQRFGHRLWICPTWLEPPDPGAVNLLLDPGNAFGTGTHATTALCLEWLEAQDLSGVTLLDYGCGSGVLCIAALRLGASRAWACDSDAQALAATAANAARNDVASRLWIGPPLDLPSIAADVVVANILSRVLVDLAPQLGRRLRPHGRLAVSGILHDQCADVIAAYAPWCALAPVAAREEWMLLAGERGGAAKTDVDGAIYS